MVDALGFTGVEGSFRRACEVTLRVLRKEKDSLINVLETLVYDPLLEWSKQSKQTKKRSLRNESAMAHISVVRSKLNGDAKNKLEEYARATKRHTDPKKPQQQGIILSVEGQVCVCVCVSFTLSCLSPLPFVVCLLIRVSLLLPTGAQVD